MRREGAACLLLVLLLSVLALAQGEKAVSVDRVEPLGPIPEDAANPGLRRSLSDKGSRLIVADGSVLAEVWLRRAVPAQPKKEIPDALYTQLSESAWVGVLRFPLPSLDYRGQSIPAGYYSLRYALMPNDGNHLGVAPSRDFLLLIPVSADSDPDAAFKFQELVSLSTRASNTKHPAVLSMVFTEGGSASALSRNDEGHYIFSGAIKLASGEDLPISFVVKGTAPQ